LWIDDEKNSDGTPKYTIKKLRPRKKDGEERPKPFDQLVFRGTGAEYTFVIDSNINLSGMKQVVVEGTNNNSGTVLVRDNVLFSDEKLIKITTDGADKKTIDYEPNFKVVGADNKKENITIGKVKGRYFDFEGGIGAENTLDL